MDCIRCNRPESEHHAFEAPTIPKGCICEPRDWGDPANIPAICSQYVRMGGEYDDLVCRTCEHDEGCHAADAAKLKELGVEP